MMTALILAAVLTVPGEAELKAKLPEIFRGAVAQYRHVLKAMEKEPADSEPGGVRNGSAAFIPVEGTREHPREIAGLVYESAAAAAATERE